MQTISFYKSTDTINKPYIFNTNSKFNISVINKSSDFYTSPSILQPISGKSYDISISNLKVKYTTSDSNNTILSINIKNSMTSYPELTIQVRNNSFANLTPNVGFEGGDIAILDNPSFIGYVDTIEYKSLESIAVITIKGFIAKLDEVSYAGKYNANPNLFPDMESTFITRKISRLINQLSKGSYLGRIPILTDLYDLESISMFTLEETQGSILRKIAQTFNRNYYQKLNGLFLMTQSTDLSNATINNTFYENDLEILNTNFTEDASFIPHTITASFSNYAQLSNATKIFQVKIDEADNFPVEYQVELTSIYTAPSAKNLTSIYNLQQANLFASPLTFTQTKSTQNPSNPLLDNILVTLAKQWLFNEAYEQLRNYITYSFQVANPPPIDAGDYIQLFNGDILVFTDVNVAYTGSDCLATIRACPLKYWQYSLTFL